MVSRGRVVGQAGRSQTAGLVAVVVAAVLVGVLVALLGQSGGDRPASAFGDRSASSAPLPSPSPSSTALPAAGAPVDAAYYGDGSCRKFPPTLGDRHLTVFLDAGHGGPDPGGEGRTAAGTKVNEKILTLPVALNAATVLRADGYTVVLSRTTLGPVVRTKPSEVTTNGFYTVEGDHRDIAGRALCANQSGADALVSIHFNVGDRSSYTGTLSTYNPSRSFAAKNKDLATLLQSDLLKALSADNPYDRGVVTDDTIGNAISDAAKAYPHLLILGPAKQGYFNTPSMMPGALIEPLFLSNPAEASLAASSAGQHLLGAAVATAVSAFLTPGG